MCKMGNSEFTIKFYLRSQRKQREFKKNRQGQQNIFFNFYSGQPACSNIVDLSGKYLI